MGRCNAGLPQLFLAVLRETFGCPGFFQLKPDPDLGRLGPGVLQTPLDLSAHQLQARAAGKCRDQVDLNNLRGMADFPYQSHIDDIKRGDFRIPYLP